MVLTGIAVAPRPRSSAFKHTAGLHRSVRLGRAKVLYFSRNARCFESGRCIGGGCEQRSLLRGRYSFRNDRYLERRVVLHCVNTDGLTRLVLGSNGT